MCGRYLPGTSLTNLLDALLNAAIARHLSFCTNWIALTHSGRYVACQTSSRLSKKERPGLSLDITLVLSIIVPGTVKWQETPLAIPRETQSHQANRWRSRDSWTRGWMALGSYDRLGGQRERLWRGKRGGDRAFAYPGCWFVSSV
jgi:hypothetical protein